MRNPVSSVLHGEPIIYVDASKSKSQDVPFCTPKVARGVGHFFYLFGYNMKEVI